MHPLLRIRGKVMSEKKNQVQLKNYNRRTVLNYIRKHGTATKAGLASVTGLTFMAIKKNLEELENLNLIRCDEMEGGNLGRKAVSYAINENFRYTIGIHINKFVTSIAVLNLCGEVIEVKRFSVPQENQSQAAFMELLIENIKEVIQKSEIPKEMFLGVGIGVPGPVDIKNGVVLTPPNIPILNYLPLKEILEARLECKVYVHKDTNVIAFAEYWFGEDKNAFDLTYIDVDMGIGSGSIIDGRINVGANCIAGEFGHITLDINGPLCNCGKKGCLEALSSGIAILRDLKDAVEKEPSHPLYEKKDHLKIEDVFEMVEMKDLLTISILNKSAYYMGIAVANLINVMDPHRIVLGGILIQKYPRYFEIVQDVANANKVKGATATQMSVSYLKGNAGVIGAGEVVTERFFNEMVNEVFDGNGVLQV